VQDVTEGRIAENQLKTSNEQLRALAARLEYAREEEGTRIAREIHDDLGSAMTGIKWELGTLDRIFAESADSVQLAKVRQKLHTLFCLADTTIATVRRIASELRPQFLDDFGLIAAIECQAEQFQARTGITCLCRWHLEDLRLGRAQSIAIFRIVQEALTNVLRHANASRVDIISRSKDEDIVIVVSDNGRGIAEDEKVRKSSLGLLGMHERAQMAGIVLDIAGVDGKGTVVTMRTSRPTGCP
jgi:signal transduction histidine kinase